MGRDELGVAPQVPDGQTEISGENMKIGDGSVAVSARTVANAYTTTVTPAVTLEELTVGHTVPREAKVRYYIRETNRGKEVLAKTPVSGYPLPKI